jgi:hypothetical protein
VKRLCLLLVMLLISGCSGNSPDIQARLEAATGISWSSTGPGEDFLYGAEGFVQQLFPTEFSKCFIDVLVFDSAELAKNAKAKFLTDIDSQKTYEELSMKPSFWEFEDPLSDFSIILWERDKGQPCTEDAASAFDLNLSR